MSVSHLLYRIEQAGGKIETSNGDLRIRGRSDQIDPDLINQVKANKNEILRFLAKQDEFKNEIAPIAIQDSYDVYPNQLILAILFKYRKFFKKYKLNKLNLAHNIPLVADIRDLNVPLFKKAICALVERHESLRTSFLFTAGKITQKIHPADSITLPFKYIDVRKRSSKATLLDGYLKKSAERRFDMTKSPLFRVTVARYSEENYRIIFVIDHVISDEFSCRIIRDEGIHIYDAYCADKEPSLAPMEFQAKEYAAWLNRTLSGEQGNAWRKFWIERFSGNTPLHALRQYYKAGFDSESIVRSYSLGLERDLRRIPLKSRVRMCREIRGNTDRIHVPDAQCYGVHVHGEAFATLKNFCESAPTAMSILVIVCIFLLLYKLTGRNDIILSVFIMLRENYSLRGIIGWLTNAIFFRNQLDEKQSLLDFVKVTQKQFWEYYQYGHYGFNQVLDDLDISLDTFGTVSINYISEVGRSKNIPQDAMPFHEKGSTAMCDVDFSFYEYDNCLTIYTRYQTDRFEPETIEYFLRCLTGIFDCFSGKADLTIGDIKKVNTQDSFAMAAQ